VTASRHCQDGCQVRKLDPSFKIILQIDKTIFVDQKDASLQGMLMKQNPLITESISNNLTEAVSVLSENIITVAETLKISLFTIYDNSMFYTHLT
jgi:hypothetical protein